MYFEQRTVSATSGISVFFFMACLPLTNCTRNGEELILNTTLRNCNTLGFHFVSQISGVFFGMVDLLDVFQS